MLGIISKNIETMDENEFVNISQSLIDCIEIQHQNSLPANINKNINLLYTTDMKNIVLSQNISLNLDTNVKIDSFFNSGYKYTGDVFNKVMAYSNNNLFVIMERSNETIEHIRNSEYGKDLDWNVLNYKGTKFYVTSQKNKFVDIFFEADGILYSINSHNLEIDYKEMTKYILENIVICSE